MDSQQLLNLAIVITLALVFVVVGRRELCKWSVAGVLFCGGAVMLGLSLLFAWGVLADASRFWRGLLLHGEIGVPPFSPIPIGYALLLSAVASAVCSGMRSSRNRG
jgi:hypothetical protein